MKCHGSIRVFDELERARDRYASFDVERQANTGRKRHQIQSHLLSDNGSFVARAVKPNARVPAVFRSFALLVVNRAHHRFAQSLAAGDGLLLSVRHD